MAIKTYKPTTPSRRQMTVTDYSELSKVAPEKSLLAPLDKKAGRNSYLDVAAPVGPAYPVVVKTLVLSQNGRNSGET